MDKDIIILSEKLTHYLNGIGVSSMSFNANFQYLKSKTDKKLSIFERDENGDVIGAILVCEDYLISKKENSGKGIEGVLFFIDEDKRGTGLDKKMLNQLIPRLKTLGYTYLSAMVMSGLKTHNYWKRFGFVLYSDTPSMKIYYKEI
jgi:GNAT superfamily N-acetyltransferase